MRTKQKMKVFVLFVLSILLIGVNSRNVCDVSYEKASTGCSFKNQNVDDDCDECEDDIDYRLAGAKVNFEPQNVHWVDIINSTFVKPKSITQPFKRAKRVNILGCRGLKNVDVPLFDRQAVLISIFMTDLENVGPNVFKNSPEIGALILTKDSIKTIDENAFRNLRQLRSLDLGHNEIKSLNDDTFAGNVYLENLSLDNNNLVGINSRLFSRNRNLRSLDVQGNKIWLIEDGFTNKLGKLSNLNLKSNRCTNFSVDDEDEEQLDVSLSTCYRNHRTWLGETASESPRKSKKKSKKSSDSSNSSSNSSDSNDS